MFRLAKHGHRRFFSAAAAAILWIGAASSAAHAHGGMAGPDDLGPPLFTSIALAFVCYWAVVLWPSSKRERGGDPDRGRSSGGAKPVSNRRKSASNRASRQRSGAERTRADLRR